jgi:RNA polymerase sigma factor (sigma-70 family)
MLLTPALLAQSDTRLIELARAGHERAFEALVRRYRRELLAHCRRILPADSAEDAVQHGLMGAWTALQNGTEVRGARAWLHRVVHNAALRSLAIAGGHAELTDVQLGTDGPEEQLIRREDLRDTLHALASLPELQREALVLTTVEGQSYESVAEMLGLSQTSLRGLIYRARASMRAAASAVVPLPLLSGLLARGRQASAAARLTAASSAGAPAALGGLLTKGGAVVLAVGAAAGGVGVAHLVANRASHHPAPHRVTRPQNS